MRRKLGDRRGRPRYDIVACLALLAAVAAGLVKPDQAFTGFSDDIVVIVGSALVSALLDAPTPDEGLAALRRLTADLRAGVGAVVR